MKKKENKKKKVKNKKRKGLFFKYFILKFLIPLFQ